MSFIKREEVQKFVPSLLMLGLVLISVFLLSNLIAPILLGCVFTLVLFPLYKKLCSFRLPRMLASILVTLAFAMFFLLPISFFIIAGTNASIKQISKYQESNRPEKASMLENLQTRITESTLTHKAQELFHISNDELESAIKTSFTSIGQFLVQIFETLIKQIPQAVLSVLIILLTIFFGFISGEKAREFIRRITPLPDNRREALFQIIYRSCYSVVFASIASGIVQSLIMALACTVTGVQGTLFICLITFMASFVPAIGTAPVSICIVVYLFVTGQIWQGVVFAVFGVLIGFVDNVGRPFLLKRGINLHPFLALIFVIGAVSVIGFYGLFFGPIVACILSGCVELFTEANQGDKILELR